MVTTARRRTLNDTVTRLWSVAAPAYDSRLLQRWVYRPAQDEIIARLRSHESRRIADIACGTGILASRIDRELRPEQVYGVDMSEGMLAAARARSPRVHWLRGPAEQLPFDDGALDAVVTTSAFHFFDQPAAMREFHRVLAPGGLLAVTTLSSRQRLPLQDLVTRKFSPAHNPSPAEMQALFDDAGFAISEQHPVRRPAWTRFVSDLVTVGTRA